MTTSSFSRSTTLALLLTTYTLLLHTQVDAAKITDLAKINTTTISTSMNIPPNESPVAVKVVMIPTSTPNTTQIEVLAETKENIKDDIIEDINKKAVAESADDDDEEDEDVYDDDEEEDENNTKSETELEPTDKDDETSTTVSVWGVVRTMWNWIKDDISESIFGGDETNNAAGVTRALVRHVRSIANVAKSAVESRTFGKIRRMQMALVPLIFKFGVLTAMVAFLIMLGMKTLFLVKLLVLMNAAAILGKFITLKSSLIGHEQHAPSWGYQSWAPPASGGWIATGPAAPAHSYGHEQHGPSKEIHLHIHGGQVQGYGAGGHEAVSASHGWHSRSDPYAAYAPTQENEFNNELNNMGPIEMLPTRYPSKKR